VNRPVYVSCECVLSRNVLIVTAGAHVSVELVPHRVRNSPSSTFCLSLSVEFMLGSLGPAWLGPMPSPSIFSDVAHKQATCRDVHLDDQIHGRVVVLDTGDGNIFGAFGIDKPTLYESNACASEECELPTCRGRVEHDGGGEDNVRAWLDTR